MTTESQAKLARYSAVEKEADDFGRVIGVRRLKPSEQTKFAEMTSGLTGHDEAVTPEGEKISVTQRLPLIIVASVCYISDEQGEARIPFPRNRGELDAMYDRLDAEGLAAASKALVRLSPVTPTDPKEEAKNL